MDTAVFPAVAKSLRWYANIVTLSSLHTVDPFSLQELDSIFRGTLPWFRLRIRSCFRFSWYPLFCKLTKATTTP